MNTDNLVRAEFLLAETISVRGYHNPSDLWNGFCKPFLTFEELQFLAEMCSQEFPNDESQFQIIHEDYVGFVNREIGTIDSLESLYIGDERFYYLGDLGLTFSLTRTF